MPETRGLENLPKTKDRRTYQASRRAQAVTLYFRGPEELAAYRGAASEGGYATLL